MKIQVSLSDMKISQKSGAVLCARELGSDIAISGYDPETKIGGMLHIMLPDSTVYPDASAKKPLMFADTGIPKFLKAISAQGAPLERLIISVAGGADFLIKGKSMFTVGKQNIEQVISLLTKNNIKVAQQTIGGTTTRDLFIDLDTGKSWVAAAHKGLD